MQTQPVDPSISRTPLPLDADDLADRLRAVQPQLRPARRRRRTAAIVEVRADETNPITNGYVCNKAFSIAHYVEHAQRVQHPLRRRADGTFERIDVGHGDRRDRRAAARRSATAHSPRAIALVGIGGQANHMDAPYGLGVPARPRLAALVQRLRAGEDAAQPARPVDVRRVAGGLPPRRHRARALPARARHEPEDLQPRPQRHRHLQALRRRPGPHARGRRPARDRDHAQRATATCACGPGTDVYLLLAHGGRDRARGPGRRSASSPSDTIGFDGAARGARRGRRRRDGARAAASTSTRSSTTARGFAHAESAAIFFDLGVEQTPFSTLISYLIRVLLVLTGNLGRPGGDVFLETFLPPDRRTRARQRARARARVGHPGDPRARQLRHVLADAGARGDPARPSRAHARRHRRGLQPAPLVLRRAALARGARAARPAGRDRPGDDRDGAARRLRAADAGRLREVGDRRLPARRYPEIYVQVRPPVVPPPAEALPEPEIYVRLAEAMRPVRRRRRPSCTSSAAHALDARRRDGLPRRPRRPPRTRRRARSSSSGRYRTLGPHLPAPSLAAIWLHLRT